MYKAIAPIPCYRKNRFLIHADTIVMSVESKRNGRAINKDDR